MAKTYNTFTNVATGDVYTAASHNAILTNLAGYRVPPMCKVRRTSNLTSYTTATVFDWQAVSAPGFDTDGMWSASTPSRITIQTAGIYMVTFTAWVTFSGTATAQGPRISHTRSATTQIVGRQLTQFSSTSGSDNQNAVAIMDCAAGDFFTFDYVLSGGTSVSILSDPQTWASAVWLGQVS